MPSPAPQYQRDRVSTAVQLPFRFSLQGIPVESPRRWSHNAVTWVFPFILAWGSHLGVAEEAAPGDHQGYQPAVQLEEPNGLHQGRILRKPAHGRPWRSTLGPDRDSPQLSRFQIPDPQFWASGLHSGLPNLDSGIHLTGVAASQTGWAAGQTARAAELLPIHSKNGNTSSSS